MRALCSQVPDPCNGIQITLSGLPGLGLTSQHPGIGLLLLLLMLLLQMNQLLLLLLPQVFGTSDSSRSLGDSLTKMMDGLSPRIPGCGE